MSSTPAESRAAFAIPQGRDGAQDMLSIGQQCTAPACTLVDFLPFKCDHCANRFCQEHHRPENHDCAKWDARVADRRALECPLCSSLIAIPPGEDPNVRMGQHVDNECVVMTGKAAKKSTIPICSRARCEKRLWQPIQCEKCHQQFCAAHRYPMDHSCSSTSTPVTTPSSQPNPFANFSSQTSAKSVAAMAAIKRSLVSSSSSPARSLPPRAPALATSASASSAASGASTAPNKVKAVFSHKDRRDSSPPPSTHAAPSSSNSVADNANNKLPSPTPSPSTSPLARCAPNQFALDPRSFVPRPLFGTA